MVAALDEKKVDNKYRSRGIPVIESMDTKYVGSDGDSVLGWTVPRDRIVLHPGVIGMMAYKMHADPDALKDETLIHERQHNENPYASEAANRVATTEYMMSVGKKPSKMHTDFYFN